MVPEIFPCRLYHTTDRKAPSFLVNNFREYDRLTLKMYYSPVNPFSEPAQAEIITVIPPLEPEAHKEVIPKRPYNRRVKK